jgi:hypothetical protein
MTEPPQNRANGARQEGGGDALASPPAGPPLHPPLHPPPAAVAELAAACERFVLTKYGVKLDRKPETLSVLDQYVRDARAELAVTGREEGLPLLQATIGAYLGEVVREAFASSWFAEGDHDAWRLDLVDVFLTFNPIGVAREALMLTDAEGWHAHLEIDEGERGAVEQRLAALPEVPDEEFYAPSTRFEVLEIAVDAIRARMEGSGVGDVTFGPEDYRSK